jgi:hypothetical protein
MPVSFGINLVWVILVLHIGHQVKLQFASKELMKLKPQRMIPKATNKEKLN